jgi:hypothetical protein
MYSIIEINGGIGKSIMATAVVAGIKKKYPDREVLVITGYPMVFLNNPNVFRVFRHGNCPYFYDEYVRDKDVIFFCDEPYRSKGYLNQEEHLIHSWGKILDVECEIKPELYLTPVEEDTVLGRMKLNKPLLIFQPFGGPTNQGYSWNRDIPAQQAQEIANRLSQFYHVVQPCVENQLKLQNCEHVTVPLRELFVLVKHAECVVGIDSVVQHARKAFGKTSTVCWVTNKPLVFGYEENINIFPNKAKFLTNATIDGYLHEYDFSGSRKHDFPFKDSNIFDVQEILGSVPVPSTFIDEYFDMTYVINLDKRKDRWEHMEVQLKNSGINNYTRMSATVVSDKQTKDIPHHKFKMHNIQERFKKDYVKGAVGCRRSHLRCIQDAKEKGYEKILILEDDVEINPAIHSDLSSNLPSISDWQMLYFGGDYQEHNKTFQTSSYAINSSLYDEVINNLEASGEEIDFYYVNNIQPKIRCYRFQPQLITQLKVDSDIPTEIVIAK